MTPTAEPSANTHFLGTNWNLAGTISNSSCDHNSGDGNSNATQKHSDVTFGRNSVAMYHPGEGCKDLTPLPDDVAARKYPNDLESVLRRMNYNRAEETRLRQDTTENARILSEWEDNEPEHTFTHFFEDVDDDDDDVVGVGENDRHLLDCHDSDTDSAHDGKRGRRSSSFFSPKPGHRSLLDDDCEASAAADSSSDLRATSSTPHGTQSLEAQYDSHGTLTLAEEVPGEDRKNRAAVHRPGRLSYDCCTSASALSSADARIWDMEGLLRGFFSETPRLNRLFRDQVLRAVRKATPSAELMAQISLPHCLHDTAQEQVQCKAIARANFYQLETNQLLELLDLLRQTNKLLSTPTGKLIQQEIVEISRLEMKLAVQRYARNLRRSHDATAMAALSSRLLYATSAFAVTGFEGDGRCFLSFASPVRGMRTLAQLGSEGGDVVEVEADFAGPGDSALIPRNSAVADFYRSMQELLVSFIAGKIERRQFTAGDNRAHRMTVELTWLDIVLRRLEMATLDLWSVASTHEISVQLHRQQGVVLVGIRRSGDCSRDVAVRLCYHSKDSRCVSWVLPAEVAFVRNKGGAFEGPTAIASDACTACGIQATLSLFRTLCRSLEML